MIFHHYRWTDKLISVNNYHLFLAISTIFNCFEQFVLAIYSQIRMEVVLL